jgi:hypothetical protein
VKADEKEEIEKTVCKMNRLRRRFSDTNEFCSICSMESEWLSLIMEDRRLSFMFKEMDLQHQTSLIHGQTSKTAETR